MIVRALMSLLLVAFLLPASLSGCTYDKDNQEEEDMISSGGIPPIDASVPANIETATFALG